MSVIVVAQGTLKDRKKIDAYLEKAGPTIGPHGGKILAFDENPDVVEGAIDNPRTVLLEFDSKDAFHAWYTSPEYQEALPLRLEAAPGSLILVQGLQG
ncbi:MAG: DUF1330 domain-containing protein [Dehalococcoidia bacterium]